MGVKIIFRRINGKIIPVKLKKNISEFITNREAHDHYKAKGYIKMVENDTLNSGSLIHEKANIKQGMLYIQNGMGSKKTKKMAFEKARNFILKNRIKLERQL